MQREQDARKIKENRDKFFSARAEEDAQSAKRTAEVIKLPADEGAKWQLHPPVRHPREIRTRPSNPFGHRKKKKKSKKGKKKKKSKKSKKGKKIK